MTPSNAFERIFPIPSGDYGAWMAHARPLPVFECEAMFGIQDSLYVGPRNNIAPGQWETEREPIVPPEIPRRFAGHVTTTEVVGREDALVDYYRGVIDLLRKHDRMDDVRPFPCFRTEPAILSGEALLTEFSWNDDFYDTKAILEILAQSDKAPPSLLHQDCDQGWDIMIVAEGPSIFLIEWDGEGLPPTDKGLRFDAHSMATQAAQALGRFLGIHAYLVDALGQDYWIDKAPAAPKPRRSWRSVFHRFLGMG
jgi:hypothetical protein